jgi:hypothetical protein
MPYLTNVERIELGLIGSSDVRQDLIDAVTPRPPVVIPIQTGGNAQTSGTESALNPAPAPAPAPAGGPQVATVSPTKPKASRK